MNRNAQVFGGLAVAGVALAAGTAAILQSRRLGSLSLLPVASFDHQVTGVAATEQGRLFVNFPRWTEDVPISAAALLPEAL